MITGAAEVEQQRNKRISPHTLIVFDNKNEKQRYS